MALPSLFRRAIVTAVFLTALPAFSKSVLLVSIDGMRPDYITHADEYGLKVPNLRRMMKGGAFAEGVTGVVPTVTYPSHTTMVTGVTPAVHGIYANTVFDPGQKNLQGWYWYTEDIQVPTLWDAVKHAGLTTASVNWPVTVGAKVDYLIPEVWRAGTAEDRKLVRALSTPGLMPALESVLGHYADEIDTNNENDRLRAQFAMVIIRQYKPNFITVHLAALDHAEHLYGPFSPQANRVMEDQDELIGELRDAALQADSQATVCVVSDHGFLPVEHRLNLAKAFLDAGLMTLSTAKSTFGTAEISAWQAMPWVNGGSAAVVLKDPRDQAVLAKTEKLLQQLAANPENGINRIIGREELARLGGYPTAAFLVDMKSGFEAEFVLDGPLRRPKHGGTHGYLPEHPELNASFFVEGPGITTEKNLGVVSMLQIAPTLAGLLGVPLPTAVGTPLPIH